MHCRVVLLLSSCFAAPLVLQGAEPDTVEFFEKQVRPLLAAHCYECHGAKKQQASLRLDSRESMLHGGENGPAIVLGEPEKSRLIAAVRRDGDLQMPPKSKL